MPTIGVDITGLLAESYHSRNIDPKLIADLWTVPKSREETLQEWVEYMHTYGSKAFLADDEYYRRQAAAAYDRCYAPDGANRQILAICATTNVKELIQTISVPTLVVHGANDPLIPPELGLQTAELIRGAKFELVDGM